jgi:hypothetical protein
MIRIDFNEWATRSLDACEVGGLMEEKECVP